MLLDIPGRVDDLSTSLGRVIGELSDLIVFKPGINMGWRQYRLERILRHNWHPDTTWYERVSFETLERVHELVACSLS